MFKFCIESWNFSTGQFFPHEYNSWYSWQIWALPFPLSLALFILFYFYNFILPANFFLCCYLSLLQISAFFQFSKLRKGRLYYICLVGRSVGWSVRYFTSPNDSSFSISILLHKNRNYFSKFRTSIRDLHCLLGLVFFYYYFFTLPANLFLCCSLFLYLFTFILLYYYLSLSTRNTCDITYASNAMDMRVLRISRCVHCFWMSRARICHKYHNLCLWRKNCHMRNFGNF